jgi:hypothetical protein
MDGTGSDSDQADLEPTPIPLALLSPTGDFSTVKCCQAPKDIVVDLGGQHLDPAVPKQKHGASLVITAEIINVKMSIPGRMISNSQDSGKGILAAWNDTSPSRVTPLRRPLTDDNGVRHAVHESIETNVAIVKKSTVAATNLSRS